MKRIITSIILVLAITIAWAQEDLPTFTSMPEYTGKIVSKEGISVKRMADKTLVYIVNTCETNHEEYKIGGSENRTFLVDCQTGTHYQARGIVDNVVPWGKTFCVKGMMGKKWAVAVEFPPLPKSVKTIKFLHLWDEIKYEVYDINNLDEFDYQTITYDRSLPKVPKLKTIQDASQYNKYDKYTFPIYGNEWAVAPLTNLTSSVDNNAIWCTKECTVVATVHQLTWDMHYFQQSSQSYIVDCKTGEKYQIKGQYGGIPFDVSYNIKGISGEWICTFDIYPPLPETCTVIDIIDGDVHDNVQNGAYWGNGKDMHNIPVSRLQANQGIVNFQKTKIVR